MNPLQKALIEGEQLF